MVEERTFRRPLWMMLIILAILIAIAAFVPEGIFLGMKVRKMNLFSDVTKKTNPASRHFGLARILGFPTQTKIGSATGTNSSQTVYKSNLNPFFAALSTCKTSARPVRIAYFGDSIIEGDLITQELRKNLQTRFGGSGVGFVPITSVVSNFRTTIHHSFSPDWSTFSLMTVNPRKYPMGMSGFVSLPLWEKFVFQTTPQSDSSGSTPLPRDTIRVSKSPVCWVKYRASSNFNPDDKFHRMRLFYENAPANYAIFSEIDDAKPMKLRLSDAPGVQELRLGNGQPADRLTLTFPKSDQLRVFGMSFDDRSGIYVDNYALRGYSGMFFTNIPTFVLEGFHNFFNYDLIILQYGANVSNPKVKDYGYYRRGMINSIRYLQSVFPNTPILLVAASDRSVKINNEFQTSPDLPLLVNTQAEVAQKTNIAFWNLYEQMGGFNSMLNFVNAVPPMAQRDYTHFNSLGTNKIADMLTNYLMVNYEKYTKTHP